MKKLFVVLAALIGLGIVKVYADDTRNVPGSGNVTSILADYGGVDVATNSFYIGLTTVPSENSANGYGYIGFKASTTNINGIWAQTRWTVYGAIFSSGVCGTDFVGVYQSSSSALQAREVTRLYNVVGVSTTNATTALQATVCSGLTPLRWPIRTYGQLFYGVNIPGAAGGGSGANPYNQVNLLYYRENQ